MPSEILRKKNNFSTIDHWLGLKKKCYLFDKNDVINKSNLGFHAKVIVKVESDKHGCSK